MTSKDVLYLYNLLKENGIAIWIDGGWCIDALLGKQTRAHDDLDIAVQHRDNAALRSLLEKGGFREQKHEDSSDWIYVLKDTAGKEVDVHVFEYDQQGKNTYGVAYPYGSLTGTGSIDGQVVSCVGPKWIFTFKTGYEPRKKDLENVQALSQKFGYELPASHRPTSQS